MTFWVASGFFWHGIASFIKIMIKQSNNKARCYHILLFTVLKEQRMVSSQKIHKGRCFTFIKGQWDSCLLSELNLPVLYIPCQKVSDLKSKQTLKGILKSVCSRLIDLISRDKYEHSHLRLWIERASQRLYCWQSCIGLAMFWSSREQQNWDRNTLQFRHFWKLGKHCQNFKSKQQYW